METMPTTETAVPTREEPRGASRGQILVMFALFLVGLMGMLGLVTDLGMAYAQRRTMQNAADAGALAGARAIARWTATSPLAAYSDVQTFVSANQMNTAPQLSECVYVNYAGSSQGACSLTVPVLATGVRVTVSETHNTYFIRVVPGAPQQVTISATATAHVERGGFPSESPFIVCGSHSWAVKDKNASDYPGHGQDIPILIGVLGTYTINPAAIGVTFRVHDEQISQAGGVKKAAGCNTEGARFNGLADQDANAGLESGAWHSYTEGSVAGPTREKVNGIQGCEVGQNYNCVMLIPIAVNSPAEADAPEDKQIWVVGYAAFYVTEQGANSHNGQLLDDYIVSGPSDESWCRDCNNGSSVVRMSI